MITATADWPSGPVELEWHPGNTTDLPVTGSHGFIFGDTGVLVVDVRSRGLTIPGGHTEASESPAQCIIRESLEEARVQISEPVLLGHIVSDHTANPVFDGTYPVRAAQAVFFAQVARYLDFEETMEVAARTELPVDDVPGHHHEWNAVLSAALEAAKAASATK